MQVQTKKLSDLHKTEKNIRKHSERQIKEYIRSIEMFGQTKPIVAAEDGEILVGNGLYDALTAMGRTEADVYIISGLSRAQRKKLMLADNKVYEMGFTDISALDDILLDLGKDFDIPGYDPSLLDALVSTKEEVAEEIADYGRMEPEVRQTPVKEEAITAETRHDDVPLYAPPVKTPAGEFKSPEAPFVICPKCGEKIWL